MLNKILTLPQYCLPQHFLSRTLGALANSKAVEVKNLLIKLAIWKYNINMFEAAETDIEAYESFNAFFTRALNPTARKIDTTPGAILSPADGMISQCGEIKAGRVFQAKGRDFTVLELIGIEQQWHDRFMQGEFATIYLSPRDYHRVHMPYAGKLVGMTYIPGQLFSVNQRTAENVPNLFARNERVVCFFETDLGPMVVVFVGAFFVASIETVWHGVVTPANSRHIEHWDYTKENHVYQAGEEIGRFLFGSTVITLFPPQTIQWADNIAPSKGIQMGQLMAKKLT